jgi:hypothetical protein
MEIPATGGELRGVSGMESDVTKRAGAREQVNSNNTSAPSLEGGLLADPKSLPPRNP